MEIKFRAWDNGNMIYSHNNNFNHSNFQIKWFFEKISQDAVIMQFTGLTDKNGKEIYSGDIVRLPYQDILEENGIGYITAIVTFEKGSFRCREIQFDYDSRKLLPMTLFEFMEGDEIEVVGNIFEHSELLNK